MELCLCVWWFNALMTWCIIPLNLFDELTLHVGHRVLQFTMDESMTWVCGPIKDRSKIKINEKTWKMIKPQFCLHQVILKFNQAHIKEYTFFNIFVGTSFVNEFFPTLGVWCRSIRASMSSSYLETKLQTRFTSKKNLISLLCFILIYLFLKQIYRDKI